MNRAQLVASVAGVALLALLGLVLSRSRGDDAQCGDGFTLMEARCLPNGPHEVPSTRVQVPETELTIGPSDWEAEGKVKPRAVHVKPFALDAFEATRATFEGKNSPKTADPDQAASAMTRDEAAAYCAGRGGRLPTEDEWIAAAAGPSARRYPWGDTGAVCRRGAWGLASGPCSRKGIGPDTVGAHPAGDTPLGIHDLAGNVSEWVAPEPSAAPTALGVVRGGSWRSDLATEL
ncbi:MAG: SUMF1/EgtB/PvdO family nonheme iron enzyme, partial [Polyangiaceae bacterium]